jgi:hypothetical protein
MTEPLAVVRDYEDLLQAIRMRRDQLAVTHAVLDDVSGLQIGYVSKMLADPPVKNMGIMAMGPLLGALGVQLLMVEDPEAFARVRGRLTVSSRKGMHTDWIRDSSYSRWAGLMGKRSSDKRAPAERKRIARLAGMARARSMTAEQRIALAKIANRASAKARKRRRKRASKRSLASARPEAASAPAVTA